jgi:hypothetical protein
VALGAAVVAEDVVILVGPTAIGYVTTPELALGRCARRLPLLPAQRRRV